ncbi:MAG: serine hydrolase, partial [Anaerolineae bacterium]|nr:serine hydrolase [Anaerolineae bacterium]
MSRFPRSTPEAQGIASQSVSALVSTLESQNAHIHSFMLLRHGHLIAEGWWHPYCREDTHSLYSLTKSFTSTAIGLLISSGRLSLDDTILSIFPEDAPPNPSPNLQAMAVRHLLSMSNGHDTEVQDEMLAEHGNVIRAFLAHPVPHQPGTHFLYNSIASHILSEIVRKLTGEHLVDFLRPRLFEPLGITHYYWETRPFTTTTGGWGLHLTTADIAAFGQLYLNKGLWNGQQLIPAAWVELATSFKVSNGSNPDSDWEQGYCYQFWRCRHNMYRGDGAFGQYCVVMPEYDAVLAVNAGLGDMQLPLNAVWEQLLPAMQPAPLPEDPAAQSALAAQTAQLALPTIAGTKTTALAQQVFGRRYTVTEGMDGITAVQFDSHAEQTTLTLYKADDQIALSFGHGAWQYSEAAFHPRDVAVNGLVAEKSGIWQIAASGAWTDEHTYTAKLWWIETPFAWTFTCHFEGSKLTIEQCMNVGFEA